jgi:pimeloyl-ACP methyl ester carboxylesterase
MKNNHRLTRSFLAAAALMSLAAPFITAEAQTRRGGATASARTKPAASKCNGAWTGSITYTRTQSMSDTKTTERVSNRGKDTTTFEMKYDYKAQVAVVESPEQNGRSEGKATINHSFTSSETTKAVEKNSCDRGKTWRDMKGDFVSQSQVTGSAKEDASVGIGVNNDGTYSVSVGLPRIKGQSTGKQTAAYSGQCVPKEGKNLTMPATETTIEGNSLTSDGSHRIDPSDPNRLSGSFTQSFQNVTETITWNLQKCGAPLRLIDLKFEEMKYPNWNDWVEVTEQKGTTDGNLVRIKAKVLNASGETKYADVRIKETYKGDKWDGARPDAPLEDLTASVRVEPGEERDVEFVWDSSGYAWYDDGRPRLVQRIKAELEENGKKADEMTKNLKVAPKPVVLVHGLWSNWRAWESWQNILTTSHSYDWKAYPVGEKPEKGIMNTGGSFLSTNATNSIFENSQELGKYIRYAQEDRNAWHVDIVAHSMGGLISRHYIHHFMPPSEDGRPQVAHFVMLGTPNMGSPCADVMNTAFETLGKNVEAVRQLRQDVAAEFNRTVTNRKGVKFSVLAGDPLPVMCKTYVWNDGVVPVPSATWQIKDNAKSKNVHTELTGTADFSNFVKPRLAIGPKGNHLAEAPEAPSLPNYQGLLDPQNAEYSPRRFYGASTVESDVFARWLTVEPGTPTEIELPIAGGVEDLGLTFIANASISVTLIGPDGSVAGKDEAGSRTAGSPFRSIYVERGVKPGIWKVRISNTGREITDIALTSWSGVRR